MKRRIMFVILVLCFITFIWCNQGVTIRNIRESNITRRAGNDRDIITIFEEDFEDGGTGWEHYDETAPTDWNEEWHISATGAYEGNSWWMGDETLGGYTSHRYLVLDTPQLTLSGDPELSFMCNLNCEDTGGDPPYDAWDGANVRISTDGGVTWEVITGSPAYNGTSFYSFGYEFNEGEGIPGWGGTNYFHGWQMATFDLAAYAGEEVKIRFCFASDPAYDTNDDPDMFGMRIDDINIDTTDGLFISDGDGAAGDALMVPGYGGSTAGDLWHIYEEAAAPSPLNAMGCFDDATGTYAQGMSDFIISPEIELPADGLITWDVGCMVMLDDGTFPDCDYIHVEVRSQIPGEDWMPWTSISNPDYDPDGDNYVFTGSIETWDTFINGWGIEYADISVLAGRNVQFRFGLHTNTTEEVVPGGFRIDDFYIQQEFFQGPGPQNLTANATGGVVDLSWDPIVEGGSEGWIQWDDGLNDNAIGLNDGGTVWAAARFDASDMMPYVGGEITEMEVYISDMPDTMIVHIWGGYMAENLLLSQNYVPEAYSWNTITLDSPIMIESLTEYWIGYEVTNDDTMHSAGTDIGPAVQGKGDFIATSEGAWNELYVYDLNYNWNIHAYVDAGGRSLPLFAGNRQEREVTGYNIYRSDISGEGYELIGNIPQTSSPSYQDASPLAGAWNYYVVTAIYDGEDGEYSNEAEVFVLGEDMLELQYDDGTAEAGVNVGIAQYMGVKFEPDYSYGECVLTHVKYYVAGAGTGQYVFRIYDDDGVGGLPGANYLVQIVVNGSDMAVGWNMLGIPEANLEDVTFTEGCYWVTIFEMANAPALGKDTNTASGNSYVTIGSQWTEVVDGNLMIRSFLQYPDGLGTYGDVDSNGVIDAYDASLVLMHAVNMPTPVEPFPANLGDVDGNGYVEAYDAALILQFVVGIIDMFPVESRYQQSPAAQLYYSYSDAELVITAQGEFYSAVIELPFAVTEKAVDINSEFLYAVNDNMIAIAAANPIKGEVIRIKAGNGILSEAISARINGEEGQITFRDNLPSCIESIYPNPFNPETVILYQAGSDCRVKIDVYNIKGQKVETLLDEEKAAGSYQLVWNAENQASGVYFVKMQAGSTEQMEKLILIK